MMVCADAYMARLFDERWFNCWHLAREVWRDLTGKDLGDLSPPAPGPSLRPLSISIVRAEEMNLAAQAAASSLSFRRLDAPEDPCLALALRTGWAPHIGVVLRGKVLHIGPSGVRYEPVAGFGAGFHEVAYYLPAEPFGG